MKNVKVQTYPDNSEKSLIDNNSNGKSKQTEEEKQKEKGYKNVGVNVNVQGKIDVSVRVEVREDRAKVEEKIVKERVEELRKVSYGSFDDFCAMGELNRTQYLSCNEIGDESFWKGNGQVEESGTKIRNRMNQYSIDIEVVQNHYAQKSSAKGSEKRQKIEKKPSIGINLSQIELKTQRAIKPILPQLQLQPQQSQKSSPSQPNPNSITKTAQKPKPQPLPSPVSVPAPSPLSKQISQFDIFSFMSEQAEFRNAVKYKDSLIVELSVKNSRIPRKSMRPAKWLNVSVSFSQQGSFRENNLC